MRLNSSSGEWRGKVLSPACERATLLITRHIDGELADGDARDLRMHLAACAECRRAMDAQTSQSRVLAEKLKSLWTPNDALKKKDFPHGNRQSGHWLSALHVLPKIAACAAFMAGTLYLASTALAPSIAKDNFSGAAGDRSSPVSREASGVGNQGSGNRAPGERAFAVSREKAPEQKSNSAFSETRTQAPPAAVISTSTVPPAPPKLPETNPTPNAPCGFAEPWLFETNFEEIALPHKAALPARADADEVPVVFEEPVAAEVEPSPVQAVQPPTENHSRQSLAALKGASAPLKQLPGVTLDYALVTESGTREEGRVTLLGDVLNGKAAVRLETELGNVLEAAQDQIDTVFDARHAALVRRLLRECQTPLNRKRLETTISKLGESEK